MKQKKLTEEAVGAELASWWAFDAWWSSNKTDEEKAAVQRQYYRALVNNRVSLKEFLHASDKCVQHCKKFPAPADILKFVEEFRTRPQPYVALPAPTCSQEEQAANIEMVNILSKVITLFSSTPQNVAADMLYGTKRLEGIYKSEYRAFLDNLEKIPFERIRTAVEKVEDAGKRLSRQEITPVEWANDVKAALRDAVTRKESSPLQYLRKRQKESVE